MLFPLSGVGKQAISYASISRKRYQIHVLPKLLLMTNRKLHMPMRFRLAPRSMTLNDLELENN